MTIQDALRAVYCAFGGNADTVRNMNDIDSLISAIASLNVGDAVAAAKELPAAPESDGSYVLTATVDDGAVTYTWESAAE